MNKNEVQNLLGNAEEYLASPAARKLHERSTLFPSLTLTFSHLSLPLALLSLMLLSLSSDADGGAQSCRVGAA